MVELKRGVAEKGLEGGILSDFVGFIGYWGGCVGFDAGRRENGNAFLGENWDCSEEALKTANDGSKTGCLFYI